MRSSIGRATGSAWTRTRIPTSWRATPRPWSRACASRSSRGSISPAVSAFGSRTSSWSRPTAQRASTTRRASSPSCPSRPDLRSRTSYRRVGYAEGKRLSTEEVTRRVLAELPRRAARAPDVPEAVHRSRGPPGRGGAPPGDPGDRHVRIGEGRGPQAPQAFRRGRVLRDPYAGGGRRGRSLLPRAGPHARGIGEDRAHPGGVRGGVPHHQRPHAHLRRLYGRPEGEVPLPADVRGQDDLLRP